MAETRSGPGLAPLDNHLVFGYPVHICDHVPDNKYLCCYCNNILKAAQQTLCGHRYCSACLTWILRSRKSPICPKCAEDPSSLTEDSYLNEDKAFSDSAINKEISELSVHCATAGCRWSGVLREYEGHQVGCGAEVRGRDLADHLDHECPNNRAPPPRCSQRISREQSLKHSCESAIPKEPRSREPHLPAKGKDPQKSSQHCHFTSVGCTYR
ncbi:TNF receptor-associated factor 2-like, partial [Dendropsophus ebraccatus]|uniref:TNF receptor-associated factor 2-like n=1 Tax=Dendropsophus ebraccatus TaxID=150705 RepID=UPI003831E76B